VRVVQVEPSTAARDLRGHSTSPMNLWTVHLCATQKPLIKKFNSGLAQTAPELRRFGSTALLHNNELLCPSDNEACATDGLSCS
jgi:hypothetical protein